MSGVVWIVLGYVGVGSRCVCRVLPRDCVGLPWLVVAGVGGWWLPAGVCQGCCQGVVFARCPVLGGCVPALVLVGGCGCCHPAPSGWCRGCSHVACVAVVGSAVLAVLAWPIVGETEIGSVVAVWLLVGPFVE